MRTQTTTAAETTALTLLKAHGARNDVLIVDARPDSVGHDAAQVGMFVRAICDRGNAVGGADGVYFLDRSVRPTLTFYYNADGSPAEYCGNGLRCVGRFLLECEGTDSTTVESGGVIFQVRELPVSASGVHNVAVRSMKSIRARGISPIAGFTDSILESMEVLVPNPHLVSLVSDYDEPLLQRLADAAATNPRFPAGVNTSLVVQASDDPNDFFVHTRERGAGPTASCASGAVAAATALVTLGRAPSDQDILIRNVGGPLYVRIERVGGVLYPTQSGNATYILRGQAHAVPGSTWVVSDKVDFILNEQQSETSLWWENANHLANLGVPAAHEVLASASSA